MMAIPAPKPSDWSWLLEQHKDGVFGLPKFIEIDPQSGTPFLRVATEEEQKHITDCIYVLYWVLMFVDRETQPPQGFPFVLDVSPSEMLAVNLSAAQRTAICLHRWATRLPLHKMSSQIHTFPTSALGERHPSARTAALAVSYLESLYRTALPERCDFESLVRLFSDCDSAVEQSRQALLENEARARTEFQQRQASTSSQPNAPAPTQVEVVDDGDDVLDSNPNAVD